MRGEGPFISETRDLDDAAGIALSIPANLTLIEADSFSCVIDAQKNVLGIIETKTDGDEFTIESNQNFNVDKPVQIVITLPKVKALTVNGSGVITGLNSLNDEALSMEVNGSGKIKIKGKILDVKSEINGSGELFLEGKCDRQKVEINGSGDFRAYGFESAETKVQISGSGDAEVNATDELEGNITGSGNIRYKGNPHVKTDITGSGNVQKN